MRKNRLLRRSTAKPMGCGAPCPKTGCREAKDGAPRLIPVAVQCSADAPASFDHANVLREGGEVAAASRHARKARRALLGEAAMECLGPLGLH